MQHTFLYISCRCFARLKRETSFNFLFTRFMEEMFVFLFTLFFHCRSFFTLVAASTSHFLTAAMFFFQRNWSPLSFISRSSSFPVI